MPVHDLSTAAAPRSRVEVARYTGTVLCPACGHEGVLPFDIREQGELVVAHTQCSLCNAYVDISFPRGSAWGTEPTDPMHLAVGDQPSTLLPESHFRAHAERAAERLSNSDPKNGGVLQAKAQTLIMLLLELRKFRVAKGEEQEPADLETLQRAVDVLASNGGSVPADISRLVYNS